MHEVLLSAEEQKAALEELERCGEDNTEMMERFAFFVREVFSCLTDADFLDTEKFFLSEYRARADGRYGESAGKAERAIYGIYADH